MTPLYDLEASQVPEWGTPQGAASADAGSTLRVQAMLVCTRLRLQNALWAAKSPSERRQIERHLDDTYKTGVMTASLLNGQKFQ
jgi:hypothetical protein